MYQSGYAPYDVEGQVAPTEDDFPTFQDDLPPVKASEGPRLKPSSSVGIEDFMEPLLPIREFTFLMQIHLCIAGSVSALSFIGTTLFWTLLTHSVALHQQGWLLVVDISNLFLLSGTLGVFRL
jgi:hypothetical protein